MPSFCSVVKCSMRATRDKVSFFRFPAILKDRGEHLKTISTMRRQKWVMALKRGELSETQLKNGRVCSKHFISGKPADLQDINNPDWVPCQNLGYEIGGHLKRKAALERYNRFRKRLKADVEELWCICRQSDDGSPMMQCENDDCEIKWFHLHCLQLHDIPNELWYCNNCK